MDVTDLPGWAPLRLPANVLHEGGTSRILDPSRVFINSAIESFLNPLRGIFFPGFINECFRDALGHGEFDHHVASQFFLYSAFRPLVEFHGPGKRFPNQKPSTELNFRAEAKLKLSNRRNPNSDRMRSYRSRDPI